MTIDVNSLRGTLRQLKDDVAVLHRRVEAVEQQLADAAPNDLGVHLPAEIVVAHPAAVAAFLRDRPALAQIVAEMAPAILHEFAGEPSQVVLDLYEDPEIDHRYMVYYVRLPEYTDSITDRLEKVSEQFDGEGEAPEDWVLVTTDYHPMT